MKQIIATLVIVGLAFSTFATDTDPLYRKAPVKVRERQKKAARPDIPGNLMFEFGVNLLQDDPIQMETTVFGSRTVNVYYQYEVPLGNFGLHIVPGIGLGLDRYKFANAFTLLQQSDGTVVFDDISELQDLKKSHIVANYVDIPIEFRWYSNPEDRRRSLHISVGGKIGILFDSHTKIKYDDGVEVVTVKDKRTFGLNRFRYGVTGRLGYGVFNAFGYFSLSPLFENGPANTLDTSNILVGLSVNLF
jgi:hypothetical protein